MFESDEKIHHFGCVLMVDRIPHFYMFDGEELGEGVSLLVEDEIYTGLKNDELIIVGSHIVPTVSKESDEIFEEELTYTFEPLDVYTLKSGLESIDLIDLNLLNILFLKLIEKFLKLK